MKACMRVPRRWAVGWAAVREWSRHLRYGGRESARERERETARERERIECTIGGGPDERMHDDCIHSSNPGTLPCVGVWGLRLYSVLIMNSDQATHQLMQ